MRWEYAGKTGAAVKPSGPGDLKRAAARPGRSPLATEKFGKDTGGEMRYWKVALRDYLKEIGVKR